MHTLESCRNGCDYTGIEINQSNLIYDIRRGVDLIRRKIWLGQHINHIGRGVGDENDAGRGGDAIRL
jgi:hypothetical protein